MSEFYMLPIRCWGGVLVNTAINLRVPHKCEFLDLQIVNFEEGRTLLSCVLNYIVYSQ